MKYSTVLTSAMCEKNIWGNVALLVEHSDSGKNNQIRGKIIRFDSIHADESIFRFDSQFDKTDACTLIVTYRLIITYDYF